MRVPPFLLLQVHRCFTHYLLLILIAASHAFSCDGLWATAMGMNHWNTLVPGTARDPLCREPLLHIPVTQLSGELQMPEGLVVLLESAIETS